MQTTLSFRANNVIGLSNEQIEEKEYLYKKVVADNNGNTLEEHYFSADESVEVSFFFEYNDNGQLIGTLEKDEDNEIVENRTFAYNSDGLLSKEYIHYLDGTADEISYAYNEDLLLVSKVFVDSDGEKGNYHTFAYQNGKIISEAEFDSNDKLLTSQSFTRDEQNRLVEENIKTHDDAYRQVYVYNDGELPFQRKRYNNKNQLVERISYTYNENGNYTEMKTEGTQGIDITTFEYDENQNLVLQEERSTEGELKSSISQSFDNENRILTSIYTGRASYNQAPPNYRIRNEYKNE